MSHDDAVFKELFMKDMQDVTILLAEDDPGHARLKVGDRTKRIPVIILTTTDDPREVKRCYELGCNVYITKPVDYEQFAEAMRKLGLFLLVVMIPDGGEVGDGALRADSYSLRRGRS